MREAHAHIAAYGRSLEMPSLAHCRSVADCLDSVARAAASSIPAAWLRFHSARVESWDDPRWPSLDELDRAAAVPTVIMSFDHHAAVANSAALAAAALGPGDTVPPNGLVCTDPTTGRATGLLLEQAAYRVWDTAPEPTPEEFDRAVLAALQALAVRGYTEVHDLLSPPRLGPTLAALERSGRLPLSRLRLYPSIADLPAIAAARADWESPAVSLAGGKVFADGTLNSRTALLLHPYRHPLPSKPRGQAMISPTDLDHALALTESLGLHLAVHAIGDGAVRMVLDAIERRPASRAARHRIEHAEIVDEADIPRFAQLGVVCSVQPCHLLTDIEVLTRELPDRLDRVLPLRDLLDSGAAVWFGSDVPIVRPDADDSVQAAVHRRRPGSPQAQAIAWNQRLTEAEARRAFGDDAA
jgi:predicted amidohydrolase YtcJ